MNFEHASQSEIPPCRKTSRRPRGYIPDYNPQSKTLVLIGQIQSVLDEYREHWPLTVRQIFYRLVGHHGEEKSEAFYNRLIEHLGKARRAKVIPFDAIRDDGVSTDEIDHFSDADHFADTVRYMASNYRRNLMLSQDLHIEIWCEAAGMLPQLARVAHRYSIECYSSSGFDSLTTKKNLADRICRTGKPTVILHLGDYDPSGEDIFKSADEDVRAFVRADRHNPAVDVEFRRITLIKDQVETFRLPTSPAKATDSRSKTWKGGTCQLEALAPDQIAEILETEILKIIDPVRMYRDKATEQYEREQLTQRMLR